jgi:hypothetical protein
MLANARASAIMSFNFHQVKTHERSELFKLRARIILDIETFMSDEERSDLLLFPNFFQILQKKVGLTAESEHDVKSVTVPSKHFCLDSKIKHDAGPLLKTGCAHCQSRRTLCQDDLGTRCSLCWIARQAVVE